MGKDDATREKASRYPTRLSGFLCVCVCCRCDYLGMVAPGIEWIACMQTMEATRVSGQGYRVVGLRHVSTC